MALSCGKCGKRGVRLYRPYANFYRAEDNRCNACLTKEDRKWYVPLIVDGEGIPWGYGSLPNDAYVAFMKLPESDKRQVSWTDYGFL